MLVPPADSAHLVSLSLVSRTSGVGGRGPVRRVPPTPSRPPGGRLVDIVLMVGSMCIVTAFSASTVPDVRASLLRAERELGGT